jgi:hypothetical protein
MGAAHDVVHDIGSEAIEDEHDDRTSTVKVTP